MTVEEGKYHQVRRMLASVGKPVITLRRISVGALRLDGLNMVSGTDLGYCELSQEKKDLVFLKK